MNARNRMFMAGAFALASTAMVFAQSSETSEEQIQLPDVTTVVTGDSLTAGKNAVPDFNLVVPAASDVQAPLPQLPSATAPAVEDDEPVAVLDGQSERNVYAEGLIGGGFPGYFTGDFSVYKSSGDSPFMLQFSHEGANGYASGSASNGFFDSETGLKGEKQFTFGPYVQKLGIGYNTASNGLQNQSKEFFSTSRQTITGYESSEFNLPYGFNLSLSADGEYYSRSQGIIYNADGNYSSQEENGKVLFITPQFRGSWKNFGAEVGLTADYAFEKLLSSQTFADDYTGLRTDMIHRGQFGLDAMWKNDIVSVGGNAGVVVGNHLSQNPVVPFKLDLSVKFPVGSSKQNGVVSAEGGLSSELAKYGDLEKKYSFSYGSYLPGETSDWYGRLEASVPVAGCFNLDADAEFRTTAFGNGVYEPVYTDEPSASGLYALEQKERTTLRTDIAFVYTYKILTLGATWNGWWIDVPAAENPDTFGVEMTLQGSKSNWGVTVGAKEAVGSGVDYMPEINCEAFVKLNNTLRLAVQANDVIKLCMQQGRSYAGSKYVSRGGNATVLVKFFF